MPTYTYSVCVCVCACNSARMHEYVPSIEVRIRPMQLEGSLHDWGYRVVTRKNGVRKMRKYIDCMVSPINCGRKYLGPYKTCARCECISIFGAWGWGLTLLQKGIFDDRSCRPVKSQSYVPHASPEAFRHTLTTSSDLIYVSLCFD